MQFVGLDLTKTTVVLNPVDKSSSLLIDGCGWFQCNSVMHSASFCQTFNIKDGKRDCFTVEILGYKNLVHPYKTREEEGIIQCSE